MAQATVMNRTRYFCHRCNKEISPNLQDFTCPTCLLGFIEEMSADRIVSAEAAQLFEPLIHALSGAGDALTESQRDTRTSRLNRMARRWGSSGNSGTNQNNIWEHVDDVLFGLSGGSSNSLALGSLGSLIGAQGTIGEHMWGAEGYNNIIMRLLSRMEDSGPPPASDERIAALPLVDVSDELIAREEQCVVCSEEFPADSKACVLPCKHTFHPNCISRWLKLHDTCPICRKNLAGEVTMDESPSPRQPSSAASSSSDTSAPPARDDESTGFRHWPSVLE